MTYLLDTNILIIYVRDTAFTRSLEAELELLKPENILVISVISLGEIRSIAKRNNWGDKKINRLTEILNEFIVADINTEEIIERYAEIDAYSQGKLRGKQVPFSARNMGKNDLWIASTASVLNIELITTDHDFDHLDAEYLTLNKIEK